MPFIHGPLRDTPEDGLVQAAFTKFVDFVTGFRVFRVPVLNWTMILVYFTALVKWTFHFTTFRAFNSVLTNVFTNLLLYGLADTLAQTLRSVSAFSASVSLNSESPESKGIFNYIVQNGRPRRVILDDDDDDLAELGLGILQQAPDDRPHSHPEVFNFRRWAFFSCWGVLISFPQSAWYVFLNAAFGSGPMRFISVLQRVLCDQLFYSPISLAGFLCYMVFVIERGTIDDLSERFGTAYIPMLAANYTVWPAAQFVNFLLIPPSLQIPFSSTISVFWNAYLSLKNPS